jgi:hypothetical protein
MHDARTPPPVDDPIDRSPVRPDTPGLARGADGALETRVQAARPGDAPLGNRLPAPDGPFTVAPRAYPPGPEIPREGWTPPGPLPLGG